MEVMKEKQWIIAPCIGPWSWSKLQIIPYGTKSSLKVFVVNYNYKRV
jgi:hypothetical protein